MDSTTMINEEVVPGFDAEKDDSLKIQLQKISEKTLVIYVTGYLDTYSSVYFQNRVNKAIEAKYSKLIFHLGGVPYMSSTGIGAFTGFLKKVRPQNGDVVLLQIQPKVFAVFQLLGFSQFFNVMENLDDAVNFMENKNGDVQVFPHLFKCPICGKRLRASKAGRFRCSECKVILAIDAEGQVSTEK